MSYQFKNFTAEAREVLQAALPPVDLPGSPPVLLEGLEQGGGWQCGAVQLRLEGQWLGFDLLSARPYPWALLCSQCPEGGLTRQAPTADGGTVIACGGRGHVVATPTNANSAVLQAREPWPPEKLFQWYVEAHGGVVSPLSQVVEAARYVTFVEGLLSRLRAYNAAVGLHFSPEGRPKSLGWLTAQARGVE